MSIGSAAHPVAGRRVLLASDAAMAGGADALGGLEPGLRQAWRQSGVESAARWAARFVQRALGNGASRAEIEAAVRAAVRSAGGEAGEGLFKAALSKLGTYAIPGVGELAAVLDGVGIVDPGSANGGKLAPTEALIGVQSALRELLKNGDPENQLLVVMSNDNGPGALLDLARSVARSRSVGSNRAAFLSGMGVIGRLAGSVMEARDALHVLSRARDPALAQAAKAELARSTRPTPTASAQPVAVARTSASDAAASESASTRPAASAVLGTAGTLSAAQHRLFDGAVQAVRAQLRPSLQAYGDRLQAIQQRTSVLLDRGVEPTGLRATYAQAAEALGTVAERSERMAALRGAQALLSSSAALRTIVDPSTGRTFGRSTLAQQLATVGRQLDGAARHFVDKIASLERLLDPRTLPSPGTTARRNISSSSGGSADGKVAIGRATAGVSGAAAASTSVSTSPHTAAGLDAPARHALQQVASAARQLLEAGPAPADAAGRERLLRRALETASSGYAGATPEARIERLLGDLGFTPDMIWSSAGDLAPDRFASDSKGSGTGASGGSADGGTPGGGGPFQNPHIRLFVLGTIASLVLAQFEEIPAAFKLLVDLAPWGGHGGSAAREASQFARESRLLLREGETLAQDGRILLKDGSLLSEAALQARRAEALMTRDGRLLPHSKAQESIGVVEETANDVDRTLNPGKWVKVGKGNVPADKLAARVTRSFEERLQSQATSFEGSRAQFKKKVDLAGFVDEHLGPRGAGDESLRTFRAQMEGELRDRLDQAALKIDAHPGQVLPETPKPAVTTAQATEAGQALERAAPGVDIHDVKIEDGVVTAGVRSGWFGEKALSDEQVSELNQALRSLEHSFTCGPSPPTSPCA